MIDSTISRVGIIGASDTKYMMMGLNTASFQNWWYVKSGQQPDTFRQTKYTLAGTMLESHILDLLEKEIGQKIERDRQIEVTDHLTVNLDGNTTDTIYEVKTSSYANVFWSGVSSERDYIKQVNVQMYAMGVEKGFIVYYGLLEHEYEPGFLFEPTLDFSRVLIKEVTYDRDWIENVYTPRLTLCSGCLDDGTNPWEKGETE